MPRFLIAALAAAILALPATAAGHSSPRVRGTVALKVAASHLVTVRATRQAFALRVPGSLSSIHVGQRVELRGTTLRADGHGSPVLARDVVIASSGPLSASPAPRRDDDGQAANDEIEIKGKLTSLSPATVVSSTRTVSCVVPAGKVLTGFGVNDLVEMTCDLAGSTLTLRTLEHEDDAAAKPSRHDDDEDDDDNGGHHSGSGGGGHDEDND